MGLRRRWFFGHGSDQVGTHTSGRTPPTPGIARLCPDGCYVRIGREFRPRRRGGWPGARGSIRPGGGAATAGERFRHRRPKRAELSGGPSGARVGGLHPGSRLHVRRGPVVSERVASGNDRWAGSGPAARGESSPAAPSPDPEAGWERAWGANEQRRHAQGGSGLGLALRLRLTRAGRGTGHRPLSPAPTPSSPPLRPRGRAPRPTPPMQRSPTAARGCTRTAPPPQTPRRSRR